MPIQTTIKTIPRFYYCVPRLDKVNKINKMILLQTLTKQRTRLLPVKKSIKKTRPKPIPSETKTRLSLMPVKTRQRLLPVSTKTRTSRDQDKSKNNINIVLDKPETFPVKKNIYIIPRPFQIETKLRLR